ncbi:hypothetical protein ACFQ0B_77480 [Nonomuraea thailandensis]
MWDGTAPAGWSSRRDREGQAERHLDEHGQTGAVRGAARGARAAMGLAT